MSFANVLCAFAIAVGFALWPIIGKYSGLSGGWVITVISTGTLLTSACFSAKDLYVLPVPGNKAMTLLLTAGILNGFSCWLYTNRIAGIQIEHTASLIALVIIGMVIFTPVFHFLFNGSAPSNKQLVGFVLAVGSIYFLVD